MAQPRRTLIGSDLRSAAYQHKPVAMDTLDTFQPSSLPRRHVRQNSGLRETSTCQQYRRTVGGRLRRRERPVTLIGIARLCVSHFGGYSEDSEGVSENIRRSQSDPLLDDPPPVTSRRGERHRNYSEGEGAHSNPSTLNNSPSTTGPARVPTVTGSPQTLFTETSFIGSQPLAGAGQTVQTVASGAAHTGACKDSATSTEYAHTKPYSDTAPSVPFTGAASPQQQPSSLSVCDIIQLKQSPGRGRCPLARPSVPFAETSSVPTSQPSGTPPSSRGTPSSSSVEDTSAMLQSAKESSLLATLSVQNAGSTTDSESLPPIPAPPGPEPDQSSSPRLPHTATSPGPASVGSPSLQMRARTLFTATSPRSPRAATKSSTIVSSRPHYLLSQSSQDASSTSSVVGDDDVVDEIVLVQETLYYLSSDDALDDESDEDGVTSGRHTGEGNFLDDTPSPPRRGRVRPGSAPPRTARVYRTSEGDSEGADSEGGPPRKQLRYPEARKLAGDGGGKDPCSQVKREPGAGYGVRRQTTSEEKSDAGSVLYTWQVDTSHDAGKSSPPVSVATPKGSPRHMIADSSPSPGPLSPVKDECGVVSKKERVQDWVRSQTVEQGVRAGDTPQLVLPEIPVYKAGPPLTGYEAIARVLLDKAAGYDKKSAAQDRGAKNGEGSNDMEVLQPAGDRSSLEPTSPDQKKRIVLEQASPDQKKRILLEQASPDQKKRIVLEQASPDQKKRIVLEQASPDQKKRMLLEQASPDQKKRMLLEQASPDQKKRNVLEQASPDQKKRMLLEQASPDQKKRMLLEQASPDQKKRMLLEQASPDQKKRMLLEQASPDQKKRILLEQASSDQKKRMLSEQASGGQSSPKQSYILLAQAALVQMVGAPTAPDQPAGGAGAAAMDLQREPPAPTLTGQGLEQQASELEGSTPEGQGSQQEGSQLLGPSTQTMSAEDSGQHDQLGTSLKQDEGPGAEGPDAEGPDAEGPDVGPSAVTVEGAGPAQDDPPDVLHGSVTSNETQDGGMKPMDSLTNSGGAPGERNMERGSPTRQMSPVHIATPVCGEGSGSAPVPTDSTAIRDTACSAGEVSVGDTDLTHSLLDGEGEDMSSSAPGEQQEEHGVRQVSAPGVLTIDTELALLGTAGDSDWQTGNTAGQESNPGPHCNNNNNSPPSHVTHPPPYSSHHVTQHRNITQHTGHHAGPAVTHVPPYSSHAYSPPTRPYSPVTNRHDNHPAGYHSNGRVDAGSPQAPPSPRVRQAHALQLLCDLYMTLQTIEDKGQLMQQLQPEMQALLRQWMLVSTAQTNGHGPTDNQSLEERARRLQVDKDDLQLHVSVLNDQIDAQVDKIRDLEGSCVTSRPQRRHGELLGSGTMEKHKLDLLAENSGLKLRLASSEKDRQELEQRLKEHERRVEDLQQAVNERSSETNELRRLVYSNGSTPGSPSSDHTDSVRDRTIEREKTLDRLKRKHSEVDKLKKAVDSLMVDNGEKDRHIDELRKLVKHYRRIEEVVLAAQDRKGLDYLGLDEDTSDTSSTNAGHDTLRDNIPQFERLEIVESDGHRRQLFPNATSTPVQIGNGSPKISRQLVPNGNHMTPPSMIGSVTTRGRSNSLEDVKGQAPQTPPTVRRSSKGFGTLPKDVHLNPPPGHGGPAVPAPWSGPPSQTSASLPRTSRTSPAPRRLTHTHSTLPSGASMETRSMPRGKPPQRPTQTTSPGGATSSTNSSGASSGGQTAPSGENTGRRKHRGFLASFGKGLFKLRGGKWSTSAPNLELSDPDETDTRCLTPEYGERSRTPTPNTSEGSVHADWYSEDEAQTETDEEALKDEMARQYKQLQQQQSVAEPGHRKKGRGIKRFFGKLKRSNSQEFDEGDSRFQRGGVRATAGPRLGWSKELKDPEVPFPRWDTDRVSLWLHVMGLSMYVAECKRWVKNGQQLLNATPHELEKELGIKNQFHRKKLHLALQAAREDTMRPMDQLDYNWVLRWLDDIGLPQYKDTFLDARIDGRMLHYLTVEELVTLKVTNALHHLSMKRALQVLRINNFNPSCFKRRPLPDEGQLQNCPDEVCLWTNHRVMEWLRSIDLSEYAPNLRGSGVHGGLMVLDPRFGSEIFATILSIPASKTLLRRHLSTHFVALIGPDMQQKKREFESQTGYIPLTPNQKVKLKKSLFSHKRSKSDAGEGDYVCPMISGDASTLGKKHNGSSPAWSGQGSLPRNKEESALEDVGTFSHEINTLTHMLRGGDHILDNVQTSDV